MKILIDARLYGPKDTGIGRYTKELVENLSKIDRKNKYVIFLRKSDFEELSLPNNWTKVLANFGHYTFAEQFKLPGLIAKYKPDLVHFPHFNVPVMYFGKYVVTIHDLIMHKFTSGTATTKTFPLYQIKRIGYHIAFLKAVYGSKKIIVPCEAIKDDVAKYYRLNKNKIVVTYE